MNVYESGAITAIIFLTIAGLFVRQIYIRIFCWLLAIPPLAVGLYALSQGGIVEPFSDELMIQFCSLAFLPTVGCLMGELIIQVTPKKDA